MSVPEQFAARIAAFPSVLRDLIEAELAAGNTIVEVASCFPAPPAGAYVKLAKLIGTRPRMKTAALDFYERNSSLYSGEWTDAKRFYFVLEPPHPPPPEPDMDAIRDARNAAAAAESAAMPISSESPHTKRQAGATDMRGSSEVSTHRPDSVVGRFAASMKIDYEKWHDGIGYDLTQIDRARAGERQQIEAMLVDRADRDWRDVEALAALDTPGARRALKTAMKRGNAEIRAAVLRYAPMLVPVEQQTAALVHALETAEFYGGLSQTLDRVADFHPPPIMAALFRGVLERQGDVAIHFAAMLMFIHGKANSPFDWSHRPFYLRFGTKVRSERERLFRELCAKVGANADEYL